MPSATALDKNDCRACPVLPTALFTGLGLFVSGLRADRLINKPEGRRESLGLPLGTEGLDQSVASRQAW
jgi:hypothetical protein